MELHFTTVHFTRFQETGNGNVVNVSNTKAEGAAIKDMKVWSAGWNLQQTLYLENQSGLTLIDFKINVCLFYATVHTGKKNLV